MNTQESTAFSSSDASGSGAKICKACGAETYSSAKFCGECGYSFVDNTARPQADKTTVRNNKITRIAGLVKCAMFLLFGALLFVFYAAPVVRSVGIGLDVYTLCGAVNDTAITVLMILLIVFAAVTLISAAATCFMRLRSVTDNNSRKTEEHPAVESLSLVFYLLYFIIGIVMCIVIPVAYGTPACACPVLLTVFSTVFAFVDFTVTVFGHKLANGVADRLQTDDNSFEAPKLENTSDKTKGEASEVAEQAATPQAKPKKNIKHFIPHISLAVFIAIMLLVGFVVPAFRGRYFYYMPSGAFGRFYRGMTFFDLARYDGPFAADCMYICNWTFAALCACAVVTEIAALVLTLKNKDGAKVARRALLAFGIVFFVFAGVALVIVLSEDTFTTNAGIYVVLAAACIGIISAVVLAVKNKRRVARAAE